MSYWLIGISGIICIVNIAVIIFNVRQIRRTNIAIRSISMELGDSALNKAAKSGGVKWEARESSFVACMKSPLGKRLRDRIYKPVPPLPHQHPEWRKP